MDSPGHSRNSSSDTGDPDTKLRECDDMLSRRLAGNLPAPLRKKKTEAYKQFITPSSDPMSYIRQHMRSKSMSEIEVQNAEKEQERDQRNTRYQEMQQLKEMLKEEEDTWTSNLDSWKQRRRSATFDVRKRKEDREHVEQLIQTTTAQRRRPKTYKEMLEDKKRREMGFYDDEDQLSPRLNLDEEGNSTSYYNSPSTSRSKKVPYRGAVSVPNIHNTGLSTARSPSPNATKVVVQPIKYTSKVTAVINHVPTESEDSSVSSKADNSSQMSDNVWDYKPAQIQPSAAHASPKVNEMITPVVSHQAATSPPRAEAAKPQTMYSMFNKPSNVTSPRRSQSPPPSSSHSSKTTVVMRGNKEKKERPKSEYAPTQRASTLPRNYHNYSAPKPFVPGATTFAQYRKTAFASKRSMFESMAHQELEQSRARPQHLSSLLQQDTDRLHQNTFEQEKHVSNGISKPHDNTENFTQADTGSNTSPKHHSAKQFWSKKDQEEPKQEEPKHEPIIRSWQSHNNQPEAKPGYRRVAAPAQNPIWSKSATLPSRRPPVEVKVEPLETKKEETLPSQNGLRHRDSSSSAKLKSPRSPSSGLDSLFDDMKICINQRPKSEKGFGFTVRGGDDGKPVIVNTVSPGGAADVCQLCVGDEILAINDVRLSSSLTQDGIVQLIVDSVFTGNLSLDIRRYGKVKKTNPLRLTGTKVVMTPGGFVQVRSDKGKAPVVSAKQVNGNSFSTNKENESPSNTEDISIHDLPLPPPPPDLEPPKESAVSRLSPKKSTPHTQYRTASPLSNLIQAAKAAPVRPQENETYKRHTPSPRQEQPKRYSPVSDEDVLEQDVMKVQHDLDIEEVYLSDERHKFERDIDLRQQLLEEQRNLEEREARREEEKRRRIEEAKLEEMKLEEELKRIEAQKLEQQRKREEERRRLFEDEADSGTGFKPGFGESGINHWLIEEAERRRVADAEGKQRGNALNYSTNNGSTGGALPDHVIQRLTQRNQPQRNAGNPQLPGSLTDYWNDPSTQATLL
ncbi:uncharacterized protein LOC143468450 isoform X1 [Clavelina lepadiformis]|uniref:uncharacterized protein LOC143468450 isoform X1 n=1 Tax=Clavelina lepadiformis TaxID=159417 RepID=UPI004041DBC0